MPAVEVWAAEREVAAHGLRRRAAERHDPFLVALAHDADEPGVEVDRRARELHGLRDPQSGAVEELDESAVA